MVKYEGCFGSFSFRSTLSLFTKVRRFHPQNLPCMWTIMCALRMLFLLKRFPHDLHSNGFSPVCIKLWRCSSELDRNMWPHNVHTWAKVFGRASSTTEEWDRIELMFIFLIYSNNFFPFSFYIIYLYSIYLYITNLYLTWICVVNKANKLFSKNNNSRSTTIQLFQLIYNNSKS